ncbi:MAG: CBS domain-containing protein [Pseudodesulfovibrio sp.]|uniref:CBS domain containing protein n=1 Tax=Pseudodesulfovibrio aespoeensis (strain ATCC 700646 / DSM 10631 / Aspo-2) TaxID=643562 RepID=E6VY36_PSEA9|nr:MULTISPECIES: CBS domain-containing protein [Pseudodesulfovibrio]MBU4192735.1 CBS domain-containing protein [Pseudomonadota bacterium]ADU63850.1 CBS domain containing protein [Pseudodesulfovibrio aespoeensis Aspo-2]MBU4243804.1 CBS domain-containing protein [Pseudomonadota bacterium]MBU4379977.1 CBS domain-containing protein [Pseudomonadota bacterium]MBU4475275.1 CBS domain-containing protein [Pseudomonadota bacterium]
MYVGLKMLRDFVKVTPQTLVKDAQKMLDTSTLWMLLVVNESGKLVGYVRKEDISAAMPSLMTSLEKHELNYLMSKLTVEKIYRTDIKTVSPETEIEGAADMMYEMNLAGLAVVDAQGELIGYINRNVMLDVLAEEMGYREGGSRLTLEVEDRSGVLYEVAGVIANMKLSIISTGTFFYNGRRIVVVRIDTDDPSAVAAALQDRGYKLVSPDDFKGEWT